MANKKKNVHYVNNAEFSQSVVSYVSDLNEARDKDNELPIVTDYIASCFLKIARGLSYKSNFIRYSYREEMVMDAVENCLKAIGNYNIEAATRTGKPNAFAYFTQISWYAFLRRIAKEQRQSDIKNKFITESGIEMFVDGDAVAPGLSNLVTRLKVKIDRVREFDKQFKEYKKAQPKQKKVKKKKVSATDSDLSQFESD